MNTTNIQWYDNLTRGFYSVKAHQKRTQKSIEIVAWYNPASSHWLAVKGDTPQGQIGYGTHISHDDEEYAIAEATLIQIGFKMNQPEGVPYVPTNSGFPSDDLQEIADFGSVIPMKVSETGADGEPLTEVIVCVAMEKTMASGLPSALTLMRVLPGGYSTLQRYVAEKEEML